MSSQYHHDVFSMPSGCHHNVIMTSSRCHSDVFWITAPCLQTRFHLEPFVEMLQPQPGPQEVLQLICDKFLGKQVQVLLSSSPPLLQSSCPPVLLSSSPPVLQSSCPPVLLSSSPPVPDRNQFPRRLLPSKVSLHYCSVQCSAVQCS